MGKKYLITVYLATNLIRASPLVANRLLTAMVIEMKNEISQTVRHCQAQAIINKLKDEHTL